MHSRGHTGGALRRLVVIMTGDSAVTSMSERSTYSLIFFGFGWCPDQALPKINAAVDRPLLIFRWMIDVGCECA